MTRSRRVAAWAAAAVAAAGGVLLLGGAPTRSAEPAKVRPVPVRVATVHLQAAGQASRYAAVIAPRIEANIGFRVAGKLIARLVDVGDRVAAGTVMARLDPADLQLRTASLQAQLVSATADANNAQRDFERYAKLRQGFWTTQQEYDKRQAAMQVARAKVSEIEANLDQARNSKQYATLVADGPGVVTSVDAEPGQVVSEGQTVLKVARLGEMEAAADVSEQDVAALKDATLSVELWSMPGTVIQARLRELAPTADATTRTYRAKVMLLDPPPDLKLGMTATLVVRSAAVGSVAVLPATVLTQEGTQPAVFVLDPARSELDERPVTVAGYAGDRVVVTAGVAEGDRVVTAGVQKLQAGQAVRLWTEPVR